MKSIYVRQVANGYIAHEEASSPVYGQKTFTEEFVFENFENLTTWMKSRIAVPVAEKEAA